MPTICIFTKVSLNTKELIFSVGCSINDMFIQVQLQWISNGYIVSLTIREVYCLAKTSLTAPYSIKFHISPTNMPSMSQHFTGNIPLSFYITLTLINFQLCLERFSIRSITWFKRHRRTEHIGRMSTYLVQQESCKFKLPFHSSSVIWVSQGHLLSVLTLRWSMVPLRSVYLITFGIALIKRSSKTTTMCFTVFAVIQKT